MPFGSQSGQVGFGIQSSQGVPVAATRFARLRGGSLGGDRALMIPDAEIGGNRDIPGAYLGPVADSGDLDFYPRPQMVALLLRAAFGTSASSNTAGTNEVQSLTVTGTPTGGTFTLSFRGQTTAPIAFNAASAVVQTALVALTQIGAGGVTVTGGPLPAACVITFSSALAATNVPQITTNSTLLTGGTTPAAAVTTTTPGVGLIGTHTITPGDTLPWLTIEERIGNQFESFQYTDAKVNSFKMEADATGYLLGSASLVAMKQVPSFTAQASPAWDTTPMMVGGQVAITFNGVSLPAKSFNFEINNNIETDDFRLGSLTLGGMQEKRRELKMGVNVRPDDSTLWKAAMYGATGLTAPQAGPAYQGAVNVRITTFETIGDVVGGTPYSINLEIPNCAVAPFMVTPSGDDVIASDIELTPLRPNSNVPIITATVVNNLATVS